MCGRITLYHTEREVNQLFQIPIPSLEPHYNIAPTQNVAAIRCNPEREFAWLKWGLIPSWSKGPKTSYSTFNARAESVATKPTFRKAFLQRRCIVVASGFYEWEKVGKHKQPHYFQREDGGPLALAGLWERWEQDETAVESCTIICTEANDLLRPIHDRMPVVLDQEQFPLWLDPEFSDTKQLQSLLQPYPADAIKGHRVGKLVNSPKNDTSECIKPISSESLLW